MAVDYTFGFTYPPSEPAGFGSGFLQRPTFCQHPTNPDLDQLIVNPSGAFDFRIYTRDATTKLFNPNPVIVSTVEVSAKSIWSPVFCKHPTDPNKDQVCLPGRDTDPTRNIAFVQRNPATTVFDASSSLIAAVTDILQHQFTLYVTNTTDRNKDQIIVGGSSTTTYLVQRNASTGLFDSGSSTQTLTFPALFALGVFCPHPTDSSKDQIAYSAGGTTTDVHLIRRNPLTGLFDASSDTTTGQPFGGGSGKNLTAITFSPGANALDDVLATGQGNVANGGIGILKRNPATELFDSTIAAGGANNVQLSFTQFSANNTMLPSDATLIPGINDYRQNVLAFQATSFLAIIFILRDSDGNYSSESKSQVLPNNGSRLTYCQYQGNRNKDFWLSTASHNINYGLTNDVESSLSSVSTTAFLADPVGYSGSEGIYYNATGRIVVNSSINGFIFDRFASLVSLYGYGDYTRQSNTRSTYNEDIQLIGTAELTGDFELTLGPSTTLDISASSRTTFTERISLSSTSTVIVGASVNLEAFTFAAGTTVNADDGVGPYTVTVANNPGIVAGPEVTIAAPELTLTITGVPAGGIFTIWDDDDPDPQDLGTLLQETKPTSGGAILYQGTPGNNVIFQLVPKSGASLGFKEFNVAGVIPATSQTLNLSSSLVPETNI